MTSTKRLGRSITPAALFLQGSSTSTLCATPRPHKGETAKIQVSNRTKTSTTISILTLSTSTSSDWALHRLSIHRSSTATQMELMTNGRMGSTAVLFENGAKTTNLNCRMGPGLFIARAQTIGRIGTNGCGFLQTSFAYQFLIDRLHSPHLMTQAIQLASKIVQSSPPNTSWEPEFGCKWICLETVDPMELGPSLFLPAMLLMAEP